MRKKLTYVMFSYYLKSCLISKNNNHSQIEVGGFLKNKNCYFLKNLSCDYIYKILPPFDMHNFLKCNIL